MPVWISYKIIIVLSYIFAITFNSIAGVYETVTYRSLIDLFLTEDERVLKGNLPNYVTDHLNNSKYISNTSHVNVIDLLYEEDQRVLNGDVPNYVKEDPRRNGDVPNYVNEDPRRNGEKSFLLSRTNIEVMDNFGKTENVPIHSSSNTRYDKFLASKSAMTTNKADLTDLLYEEDARVGNGNVPTYDATSARSLQGKKSYSEIVDLLAAEDERVEKGQAPLYVANDLHGVDKDPSYKISMEENRNADFNYEEEDRVVEYDNIQPNVIFAERSNPNSAIGESKVNTNIRGTGGQANIVSKSHSSDLNPKGLRLHTIFLSNIDENNSKRDDPSIMKPVDKEEDLKQRTINANKMAAEIHEPTVLEGRSIKHSYVQETSNKEYDPNTINLHRNPEPNLKNSGNSASILSSSLPIHNNIEKSELGGRWLKRNLDAILSKSEDIQEVDTKVRQLTRNIDTQEGSSTKIGRPNRAKDTQEGGSIKVGQLTKTTDTQEESSTKIGRSTRAKDTQEGNSIKVGQLTKTTDTQEESSTKIGQLTKAKDTREGSGKGLKFDEFEAPFLLDGKKEICRITNTIFMGCHITVYHVGALPFFYYGFRILYTNLANKVCPCPIPKLDPLCDRTVHRIARFIENICYHYLYSSDV